MFKKILQLISGAILLILAFIALRTFTAADKQTKITAAPTPELPETSLLHFQRAIQFKTISYANPANWDSVPFLNFRNFIDSTFPLVHKMVAREIIGSYSYLYKWEGKNPSLAPYILMAHQDVVPIEEGTSSMWTVDPFAGTIKDGFIWGRGTTDDKINLISILEATEKLLRENYQPERTVYFAFGHDEEIGGKSGAMKIAELLESRKVRAEMIMDEGGFVTKEKIPGMTKPVALIGTAEKGYLSLEFLVNKKGGHSSIPANETAIDILTKAIVKLRENPFEARFVESTKDLLAFIGPEMNFPNNMAFANPWIFKNIIFKNYEKSGEGNAMIRTTGVPTIIHSGIKDNVVPTLATAVVNFRLLPGDSSAFVIRKVKEIIHDNRVEIKPYDNNTSEASPSTPVTSLAFTRVDSIVKKSYDKVLSAPFLLVGATDSRHFYGVSGNIIKFSPMVDPIGFHGIDERVSIESYRHSLWFYEQLLRSCR